LEIRLERVPPHPRPTPHLEQYRTPPKIAADLLYRALARGDVAERAVLDLGCGTGMFAIGALLLGASRSTGVDVDAGALEVARAAAAALEVAPTFVAADATGFSEPHDTVTMNPPFGAQFAARHLDTAFVEAALRCAPVAYSLHAAETAKHIERLAPALGADVEFVTRYSFPLPAQFKFHTRETLDVAVNLYRFETTAK
ncbi:MAG: methyltransferase, partial [Euryarchaeota archaeon]|nr:methyltransferase [Euryarchaeota archaeon]